MAVYNVHAGHCPQGKGAYGAVGILKESVENSLVKDETIRLLRAEGHTVYDCTCEENTTQDGCLRKIVTKCNQHNVALDVSIHLNSGRNDYKGDNSTGGTEVWNYDTRTKAISDRICSNIAKELGIRNRGTKYNKNLYVLNSTNSPALLVECCFVDDKDDADHWNAKKCAKAIAEGILNKTISSGFSKPENPPKPVNRNVSRERGPYRRSVLPGASPADRMGKLAVRRKDDRKHRPEQKDRSPSDQAGKSYGCHSSYPEHWR